MRLSRLTAGAVLLLCQSAVIAQTNTAPGEVPAAARAAKSTDAMAGSLRSQMHDTLQKAGFSDIRVVPSSFLISAKDKAGNPVIMTVSPDSFTEVSEEGSPNSGSGGAAASEFVSVANSDELGSNLVGLDIYNNSKQDIGQIKDIAMSQRGRAQAYIVSVGGFLGMDEHYVAVNPVKQHWIWTPYRHPKGALTQF